MGHVYPSAGENGCATLAQTAHFGLIPITTDTANNQAPGLGYMIQGETRSQMVSSTISGVKSVIELSDDEIKGHSLKLMDFARQRFTRRSFIESFDSFLQMLAKKI